LEKYPSLVTGVQLSRVQSTRTSSIERCEWHSSVPGMRDQYFFMTKCEYHLIQFDFAIILLQFLNKLKES
jgi:hypothetical protein